MFFDRDEETGELYDKTSYLHEGTDYNWKVREGVERLTCHMEIWFHLKQCYFV